MRSKNKRRPTSIRSRPSQKHVETAEAGSDQAEKRVASESPVSIVGIGASAGGLEAFQEFLGALPDDTGMARLLEALP